MKEVGLTVAEYHVDAIRADIRENSGDIPGLLDLRQTATYHHDAFGEFGIEPHYYGGTLLPGVPDEWEFDLYGGLYGRDMDNKSW